MRQLQEKASYALDADGAHEHQRRLRALVGCAVPGTVREVCAKRLPAPESGGHTFITNATFLRQHHLDLLKMSLSLRPQARNPRLTYREYAGPRLEDHFIHSFSQEDYDLFAPMVPLFVQWTESAMWTQPGMAVALEGLRQALRPDVLYLTVTSAPPHPIMLEASLMITASSKVIFLMKRQGVSLRVMIRVLMIS